MKKLIVACFFLMVVAVKESDACTRAVYHGTNGLVITGRSMDWKEELYTDLWIFPRGMERSGEVKGNSLKWKSKYGSIVASAYNFASADGMNEKGLAANLLWLKESEYPAMSSGKPGLTIAAWVQYVLDNFATVDEAVTELSREEFIVVSDYLPGSGERKYGALHLSISDAAGDSAIFEYIGGKLVIYHNRSYSVLTNSPTFNQQLAIRDYWKGIGGMDFLPGTNRAADRFVRASFYIDAIPETSDAALGVSSVLSVIRNVSVPFGISVPEEPNIATTQWRVVADQTNLVYYFDDVLKPNVFNVDLKKMDFSEKAPVKRLNMINGEVFSGEVSKRFVKAEPFKFLGV